MAETRFKGLKYDAHVVFNGFLEITKIDGVFWGDQDLEFKILISDGRYFLATRRDLENLQRSVSECLNTPKPYRMPEPPELWGEWRGEERDRQALEDLQKRPNPPRQYLAEARKRVADWDRWNAALERRKKETGQ